jgi:hypothetical protein
MELNMSDKIKQLLFAIFLIILPLIVLVLGIYTNYLNAWYYVLAITWFGVGIIFYGSISQ